MPSCKRITALVAAVLMCAGCIGHGQGQINWKQQHIAPPANSFGVQTNAYILGVSNNVVWRMFPVSLLATNITAGLQFPYTAITNPPWISNAVALPNIRAQSSGAKLTLLSTSALLQVTDGFSMLLSKTGFTLSDSNNASRVIVDEDEFGVLATNGSLAFIVSSNGVLIGNGAGITNVQSSSNATRLTAVDSYTNRTVDMTAQTNVYDDIVFPLSTLNPPGLESPAVLIATNGPSGDQMALYTDVNNVLFVVAQMPHTWTTGTTIYPHIHHTPASANPVTNVWRVAYSVADIGSVLASSTVVTQQVITPAGQWYHRLNDVPTNGISMTGKVGPSTIISMKYTLLSTSEPLRIKSYDVHFRWGGSPVIYTP